jgi:hypothetical protein
MTTRSNEDTSRNAASGPPKRRDRKVIATMIGVPAVFVLGLIASVLFSDFPGSSLGGPDKAEAPIEGASRGHLDEPRARGPD